MLCGKTLEMCVWDKNEAEKKVTKTKKMPLLWSEIAENNEKFFIVFKIFENI